MFHTKTVVFIPREMKVLKLWYETVVQYIQLSQIPRTTRNWRVANFKESPDTDMGNDVGSWSGVFVAVLIIMCRSCSVLPPGGCTPPPNILVNGYRKLSNFVPMLSENGSPSICTLVKI